MNLLFLILSGGYGKRLRPATFFCQKTLLPTKRGQRIIDYSLQSVFAFEDTRVKTKALVLARHKSKQVVHYVRKNYPSVDVLVEAESLDTGGAILQHWDVIAANQPDIVIILNGDHFVRLPIKDMISQYYQNNKPTLMLVGKVSDDQYHDYIDIDSSGSKFLRNFSDRRSKMAYTGIFMTKFNALSEYAQVSRSSTALNMTRDIVQSIYTQHGSDYFLLTNEWDDLGTWPRYLSALI